MDWQKIIAAPELVTTDIWNATREELEVAYEEMSKIAPFALYGDGIDTFWDDLDPMDAETNTQYKIAEVFRLIRERLGYYQYGRIHQQAAFNFAESYFEEFGLEGNVLDSFFYPDPSGEFFNGWTWINSDLAKALLKRQQYIEETLDIEGVISWIRKYPWRNCRQLRRMIQHGNITKNTLDWHAANILFHCELAMKDYFTIEMFQEDEGLLDIVMSEKVRFGVEIGASYKAALLKQRHEKNALRGKKVGDSARAGGVARSGLLRSGVSEVLSEMSKLVENGHSISNAARLVKFKGIGSSAEANRKLWTRHKVK